MDRVARVIVERSKVFLGLAAALTILSAISLFFITFNADVSSFLTEGNPVGEELAALQERYDSADTINLLVMLDGGATFDDREALADLALIGSKLRGVTGVASVSSVVPAEIPDTGQTITSTMIENAPEEVISRLIEANPAADLLLSEDKTAALVIVTPEDDEIEVAREILELSWPEGLGVATTGQPVIYATVLDRIGWFLLVIPPVIVALLLLTFYANIGDRRLSLLSIVPAGMGALWTFGTISALGIPIDILTIIVPIFVIVMGSADGLHFVTHYQEECARTDDVLARVTTTLRQIGTPMILTTLSTMAGFLSLLITDVHPIRQLGTPHRDRNRVRRHHLVLRAAGDPESPHHRADASQGHPRRQAHHRHQGARASTLVRRSACGLDRRGRSGLHPAARSRLRPAVLLQEQRRGPAGLRPHGRGVRRSDPAHRRVRL